LRVFVRKIIVGFAWTIHGLSMEYPWSIYGLSMGRGKDPIHP